MPQTMGIGTLGSPGTVFKMKFRWLLTFIDTNGTAIGDINALPPAEGSRPHLDFKEESIEHISETIWFPVKPDWKPVNLILYDIKSKENPIVEWLKHIYNAQKGSWQAHLGSNQYKKEARLKLFDGCGCALEEWVYENAYPSSVNFGSLDMASSELVKIDITLRYDRAYVLELA